MKKAFQPRISAGLVFSMTLALFSLGLFALLLLAGGIFQKRMREEFEIHVYLQKGSLPGEIRNIHNQLLNLPFIAQNPKGTALVRLESKEDAGARFIRETGEDFRQFLGENPLRDAFHIRIREASMHADSLRSIQKRLAAIPGVFEVHYLENLAESISQSLRKLAVISLCVTLLLFATVFWLLRSSIQAAIHSGRFFIRSMELLGASPWFIRRPYVLSVGLGGAIGGFAASALLGSGLFVLIRNLPELAPYVPFAISFGICIGLIPLGFMMSFFPALSGIRAYQQRRLSDLHR